MNRVVLTLMLFGCSGGEDAEPITTSDLLPEVDADEDGDGYLASVDCDDGNDAVFPFAQERCDGVDNDCDGLVDAEDNDLVDGVVVYDDQDADGFGDDATMSTTCEAGDAVIIGGDCNDSDDSVHPDATEVCDGVDNDCDATTSERGMVSVLDGDATDATARFTSDGLVPRAVLLKEDETIQFCAGEWDVLLTVQANVTLRGMGPAATILTGRGQGPVINVPADDVTVVVEQLGVTGGKGIGDHLGRPYGAGIRCDSNAELDVRDVDVFENLFAGWGSGIASYGCDLEIHDATVRDNYSTFACGGVCVLGGTARIEDSLITGNQAISFGGGLLVQDGDVVAGTSTTVQTSATLVNTVVLANQTTNVGGGMHVEFADVTCEGTAGPSNGGFYANQAPTASGVHVFDGQPHSFVADVCDFGEAGTKDDNGTSDAGYFSSPQTFGDDASFTCTNGVTCQ